MKLFKKKGKKKKSPEAFVNSSQMLSPVQKEFRIAIKRHLESVNLKRVFRRRSALYDIPWFMVTGPRGSGKSAVLSASDLHFPLKYPQEKDGETVSGINWLFGNKVVWLDLPGRLIGPENSDLFQSVYQGLSMVRPNRPVDGIICVINSEDILNGSQESVKSLANSIRTRFDELTAFWGIELPVFCIISKTDAIPGFFEFFNDSSVQWSDQLLGASFSAEQQSESPRKIFQKEHDLLCTSLKTLRLKRLSKEKDAAVRRLICRFVIQFEGLQARAGDFFSELFKESIYEGKPVFKGFYFVSCKTFEPAAPARSAAEPLPSSLSRTIVNHPLNPHRNAVLDESDDKKPAGKTRSFFTNKLFDEVIPNGTQILSRTGRFSRKDLISYWSLTGCFTLIFILVSGYLFYSFKNASSLYDNIRAKINFASQKTGNLMEAYTQLQSTSELVEKFRGYQKKGMPLSYGPGFIKTEETYEKLKKIYFQQIWHLLVVPSTTYLEAAIKKLNADYQNLTNERHTALYRYLKTYLSISETVAQNRSDIDTMVIRETIEQGLYQAILHQEGSNRLPVNLQTILNKNIGLYCYFLKTGEMPLIQQNQRLVSQARTRLLHIPDAKLIYESIRNRLQSATPVLALDDIVGQKNDGLILSNRGVNLIYTQEGWDRFVENEISTAIKDPFKIDWVIGTRNVEAPVTDKKQMRSDLVTFYIDDICEQWLSFLQSIEYDNSGDMAGSALFLQKLSAERSSLSLLLENVLKLSKVNVMPKEHEALDAVKNVAEKKNPLVKKAVSAAKDYLKPKDPSEKIDQYFESLKGFMRSEGRYGGISAHKERLSILSEALLRCAKQGNAVEIFNGKENDPMLSAWTTAENLVLPMPEYLQSAMIPILKKPLEMSARTILSSLSAELNKTWENNAGAPFNGRLAGKYPFFNTKEEAPLDAVLDFFRPNTGTLYGFIYSHLSPYLYKDNNEWKSRPVGCINLSIKKELFELLSKADKISGTMFNSDGSQKIQTIALNPLTKNKVLGTLVLDKQEYRIMPGQFHVRFQWPGPGVAQEVSLKIHVNQNYTDEITFSGDWALVRLFESARINIQNNSLLVANWERNIQNMIIVHYGLQVQSSGSVSPFAERIFSGINCPARIVEQ